MKILLDTHIVLWFLNGERLSQNAKSMIAVNENCISVASLWEVAIKMNIGKYRCDGGFSAFLRHVHRNGFVVLPIKDEYMTQLFNLPLHHRDPFDRIIIATAVRENMTLLTADENIQQYDISWAQ